jgi:hypothetical protein
MVTPVMTYKPPYREPLHTIVIRPLSQRCLIELQAIKEEIMKLSRERRSGKAIKGSQFQLQNVVNRTPDLLNKKILEGSATLRSAISGDITWVSPLEKENHLEYQDKEFLEAIGYPQLKDELFKFWPEGGPVWDALAKFSLKTSDKHGVILLEAKSHIEELENTKGCGAEGKSRRLIVDTFERVQKDLQVTPNPNWTGMYYQYANRIAHLYFLSMVQKIPTWLVFLYFLNDKQMEGPKEKSEWDAVLTNVKDELHLPNKHVLSSNIINVFYDLK